MADHDDTGGAASRCLMPIDEDMLLNDYNDERERHFAFIEKFQLGHLRVLCPKCHAPMSDSDHVNQSPQRPMRQMICSNFGCAYVGYRYL